MKLLIIFALLFSLSAFAQYSNESELAIVKSGGNSEVQTTNFKTNNDYEWSLNKVNFGANYVYGETDEGVSTRNWNVYAQYEREVSKRLSLILGEVVESNRFVGIETRYNSDIGAKYYHIKSDPKNFFTELGYRYTIEKRLAPTEDTYDNKARFYNEINHKLSKTVQYKFWLEYVHNFTLTEDYLVNGEASLTSILNSIFSLKVAYLGRYDNRPATEDLKNFDYTTTTSIVAKF